MAIITVSKILIVEFQSHYHVVITCWFNSMVT